MVAFPQAPSIPQLPLDIQFSSVAQSCPTLCNPMGCSTSDFPVHHQLLELTQTHAHRVVSLVVFINSLYISSVHFSHSVVSDSLRTHGLQHARPPCPLPTPGVELMSIESMMPSNHPILCHPLLFLPSIFPSIRIFSNESVLCIRWPKYWEFQLHHQSFQ